MTVADIFIDAGSSKNRQAVIDFLYLSGYTANDILSLNYDTNTFLTRNGGKYQLKGKKIIHLEGPSADPTGRL
jgi:hypothetical protein